MNGWTKRKIVAFKTLELNHPIYGAYLVNNQWISNTISRGSFDEYHLFCAENDKTKLEKQYSNEHKTVKVFTWDQLPRCIKENEYLVIQCFGLQPFQLYVLRDAVKRERCPICTITHSISYHQVLVVMLINMLTYDRAFDTFICGTEASKTALANIISHIKNNAIRRNILLDSKKLYVIPHGIDCEYYQTRPNKLLCRQQLGLPPKSQVLLSVGRISLCDKIDYECLIRAFAIVNRKYDNSQNIILFIAGDDKYGDSSRLYEIAGQNNVLKNIRIYPNFPEDYKRAIYGAADIFISLSDSVQESFGITIIEAMASGLPTIATDWNGYKNLITHEINGLLSKTSWKKGVDEATLLSTILPWQKTHSLLAEAISIDPEEVAGLILRLLTNPKLRANLSQSALETSESYDWSRLVTVIENHWLKMYEESCRTKYVHKPKNWCLFEYRKIFRHYVSEFKL
jgi:glycosyltransferase involved in cell wall biosynthesis